MKSILNTRTASSLLFLSYLLFFISLVFAFNFFSSLSIGLIFLSGIIKNKVSGRSLFHANTKNLFLIACALFYLLQVISFLYTTNIEETWTQLRIKSALVLAPLALCCCDYINSTTRKKLMTVFVVTLLAASVFCLVLNGFTYLKNHEGSVFFYHSLVGPLHQHAVYFSIYIFIALGNLVERWGKKDFFFNKGFHLFLFLFFSLFLFLLASKLIISFYLFYLLYHGVKLFLHTKKRLAATGIIGTCILAVIVLVATHNPVSDRFRAILNTDLNLVKQEKYNPGIYYDDIQFRLIEWKFVIGIMNENRCWWTGVSPGEGQGFLDKKYIEKDMYIGEPERHDRGMLGYNTHNELLESLLQSGIPGVIFFLFILFSMIYLAFQVKKQSFSYVIVLLVIYSFFESIFQTQYGTLLFTFFPLFLSLDNKKG